MPVERGLDNQALLDGLGQGALLFDSSNRLIIANQAARTLLGNELRVMRAQGWEGAAAYFDRYIAHGDEGLNVIRSRALTSDRPARFLIFRNGEMTPCWASAVHGTSGEVYTLITLETPDWPAIGDVMRRYLQEVAQAIDSTSGHSDLIQKSLQSPKPNQTVEQLSRRVGGFAKLISIHMYRLNSLTNMMVRLEEIRSGTVRDMTGADRRKIVLSSFFEDFSETLDDPSLVDPETTTENQRGRIKAIVPPHLAVVASPHYLSLVLRDMVRNAIMYSMRGTPIRIVAFAGSQDTMVQIDVTDEGYGIRSSEYERVFSPFERARQPQIISEFGYGLSLYLCKHEIEAMDGELWFDSQEGGGTTFSIRLPAWREGMTLQSSSSEV